MDNGANPGLASALLQWVNSFDLPQRVETWRDLEDGQILWSVLRDIDSSYFQGPLPETDRKSKDNWIPRWQNLKHIDRMVTTYIRDECGQLPNLTRNMNPDLKAIAIDGSAEQTMKLLQSVLLAAFFSPESNERMVAIMERLGEKVGAPIAEAIGEAEALDERLAEYSTGQDPGVDVDATGPEDYTGRASFERDPELEREERLIEALQRNKELEDKIKLLAEDATEANDTLSNLKREHKVLEDELERRVHGVSSTHDAGGGSSQNERDYIAQLESDLQYTQNKGEEQERQLERYKADSATKQQIRDELQLVKAERDELAQKAKANENLKKKIQVLQEQEKASSSLRSELDAAKDQMQELDSLRDRCMQLQKANEESAKAIANGEQAIFDQKTNRQRLEYELGVLSQRYNQARDANAQLMEQSREQEERIRELEGAAPDQMESLGDELNETRREAPKQTKKAAPSTTSTDALLLQQKLDATTSRVQGLEERYLNVFQENLGLEDAIKSGEGLEKLEETSYFMRQRAQLQNAIKELETIRSKYIALTTHNAELEHRLHAAQTGDSNANVEALQQNRERQEYLTRIELELHEFRSLLEQSLSRSANQVAGEIRESNEYKLIRHQVASVREALPEDATSVVDNTAARLADKQLKSFKDLQEMTKRNEDQAAEIKVLQQQPAQPAVVETEMPAGSQQELMNLRRENKLITSAWYDLASRLQSNTVVLQRRGEVPKSWLARQRMAVGQGGLGGFARR